MTRYLRLIFILLLMITLLISPSLQVNANSNENNEETLERFEPENIIPLKDIFADYFYIGAAIEPHHRSGDFGKMLEKHYNMLVAENVMKPESVLPSPDGDYQWKHSDDLFDYAEEHGMKVRYHTLVWHSQTPNWLFLDEDGNEMVDETDPDKREANKELLLERMKDYITTVVERYKGRVEAWDVLNEIISDDPSSEDGLRDSKWKQITGTAFIEESLKLVRGLDPEAKLVINDYNTHSPSKRDFLYELILDLQEKGIPIDGVGHQTHISLSYPSIKQIGDSIEKFSSLGLDNEITELDLSIYNNDSEVYKSFDEIPESKYGEQALKYKELFDEFKRLSEYISSVVFWGISDVHTWKHNFPVQGRTDAPFVFDENFKAKPAYYAIGGSESEEPIEQEVSAIEKNNELSTTVISILYWVFIGLSVIVIPIIIYHFKSKKRRS